MKKIKILLKLTKFFKIYLIFLFLSFIVNVITMELVFGFVLVPERYEFVNKYGVLTYVSTILLGTTVFYSLFNIPGSLIFYFKNLDWKKMGILSLIFGFLLEFSVLEPNIPEGEDRRASWVQGWYNLDINGETIGGTLVSGLYWFLVWAIPSYLIKHFKNISFTT